MSGFTPFGAALQVQAATPQAGVALVNGTPTILSWTAPNDGNQHTVQVVLSLQVTSTETGGQVNVNFTDPQGNVHGFAAIGAGQVTGLQSTTVNRIVQAGSTVSVSQNALTAGAAILNATIIGA